MLFVGVYLPVQCKLFNGYLSGVVPQLQHRSSTEENLASLANKDSPVNSNDLEWDNDFVSAEELEREQLITHSTVR